MIRMSDALARHQERKAKGEEGFTLIELLVVVIIIGILAAIAIPVYMGVQNNAKDSAAKSDLANGKTAVIAYYADKGSSAAAPTSTTLADYGWVSSNGVAMSIVSVSSAALCLKAVSATTTAFYITQTSSAASTTACT